MAKPLKAYVGFTLMELLITMVIIGILAAIAMPMYANYQRRAVYSEVVHATEPYKLAVIECYYKNDTIVGCDAGTNFIPSGITATTGAVSSLAVSDGVITVTPVNQRGIEVTDVYVLTPVPSNSVLIWSSSGDGVTKGYAK